MQREIQSFEYLAFDTKVFSMLIRDGLFQNFHNLQEKIRWEWVQMCGYEACVFCMPIPLRICLSGSAHCQ